MEKCEELWAKVKLRNTEVIFCVIYRHPIPKFSEFQLSVEHSLEKLNEQKSDYYFCGDFNINLLKSNTNPSINKYSNNLFSLGCLPLIKFPTRITPTSTTLIDHIYSNSLTRKATIHQWWAVTSYFFLQQLTATYSNI